MRVAKRKTRTNQRQYGRDPNIYLFMMKLTGLPEEIFQELGIS